MGQRSWFYGDTMQFRDASRTDLAWLPALTLNVDDLQDFYRKLQEHSPIVIIYAETREAPTSRSVADIKELLDLSPYDREHFEVVVARPTDQGNVNTAIFQIPTASAPYVIIYEPPGEAVVREAIEVLCHGARRRIPSKRFVQAGRLFALAVLVAIYGLTCWLLWTWKMAPLLIFVGLLTFWAYRPIDAWLEKKLRARFERRDGIRIEQVSRAQLEERRWNNKRDWKVGAVSGPVGAVVGALLTFWLK
jgi:hypothetical protein